MKYIHTEGVLKQTKKASLALIALAFVAASSISILNLASAETNAVNPSTNDENRTKGWAHVNATPTTNDITLEFVSTRSFWSCFEYRVDDEPNTVSGANPNPAVTDGRWTQVCVNNSIITKKIAANEYIDVRMIYGAETDERFDWTRFDLLVPELQYSVNGGGHILEQGDAKKRKDWNDVSIGLDVMAYNTGIEGSATIRFHNTSNDDVDKTTFHTKQFTSFNFFNGGTKCDAAMNFTALGEWNGSDNAKVIVRAGDKDDTLRVTLYNNNKIVYDTNSGDFNPESDCVGTARTGLDNGNITIKEYL